MIAAPVKLVEYVMLVKDFLQLSKTEACQPVVLKEGSLTAVEN